MTAEGATRIDRRPDLDDRLARLAELVTHLSECPPRVAVDAVRRVSGSEAPADDDARLAVVATALVGLRRQRVDLRDRQAGLRQAARPA